MGKRIHLETVYRPKKGVVGRKLAESFRGSDIATDSAKIAVRSAKAALEPRQGGKAGSNPARSTTLKPTKEELVDALTVNLPKAEADQLRAFAAKMEANAKANRERVAAFKAGLTVAEYRKQKEAKA